MSCLPLNSMYCMSSSSKRMSLSYLLALSRLSSSAVSASSVSLDLFFSSLPRLFCYFLSCSVSLSIWSSLVWHYLTTASIHWSMLSSSWRILLYSFMIYSLSWSSSLSFSMAISNSAKLTALWKVSRSSSSSSSAMSVGCVDFFRLFGSPTEL